MRSEVVVPRLLAPSKPQTSSALVGLGCASIWRCTTSTSHGAASAIAALRVASMTASIWWNWVVHCCRGSTKGAEEVAAARTRGPPARGRSPARGPAGLRLTGGTCARGATAAARGSASSSRSEQIGNCITIVQQGRNGLRPCGWHSSWTFPTTRGEDNGTQPATHSANISRRSGKLTT